MDADWEAILDAVPESPGVPVLVASSMTEIEAYRRVHPEARRWPHLTPRSLNGARGRVVSEVRVLECMPLSEAMIAAIHPAMVTHRAAATRPSLA